MSADSVVVFICGASGRNAAAINGVYYSTTERNDGYPIFRKDGDGSMIMEHSNGLWRVKPVSCKGTDMWTAWVEGGCELEACKTRTWRVVDSKGGCVEARDLKVLTGEDAKHQVSACWLHKLDCVFFPHGSANFSQT
jgi:hypothetical protein